MSTDTQSDDISVTTLVLNRDGVWRLRSNDREEVVKSGVIRFSKDGSLDIETK